MKSKFSLLFLFIALFVQLFNVSCSKEELVNDEEIQSNKDPKAIIGEWKLVASFGSAGGPRVDYTPVDSDKTLKFNDLGNFSIQSGALCYVGQNPASLGAKFEIQGSKIVFLENSGCMWNEVYYEIKKDKLYIYFPQCIEGCGELYTKVK